MTCLLMDCRYYYRHEPDGTYTLFAQEYIPTSVEYPDYPITIYNEQAVCQFNKIYSAVCNAASVSFVFCSASGSHVCRPNAAGSLQIEKVLPPGPLPSNSREGALHTSDLAMPVLALVLDYISSQSGHFHIGMMALPCGAMDIPKIVDNNILKGWLHYWQHNTLLSAEKGCTVVFRDKVGHNVAVQCIAAGGVKRLLRNPT